MNGIAALALGMAAGLLLFVRRSDAAAPYPDGGEGDPGTPPIPGEEYAPEAAAWSSYVNIAAGVNVVGLQWEITSVVPSLAGIVQRVTGTKMTITSAVSARVSYSLHPLGLAIDIRDRDFSDAQITKIVADFKAALGPNYDVVREYANTPGATGPHIHVEYDPE